MPASRFAQARKARLDAWTARLRNSRPQIQPATFDLTAAWISLGPAQTLTPAYGPVTGRITSIAIDAGSDHTGNTVYLGTTGGGIWKSTNAAGAASQVIFAPMTDAVPAVNASGVGSLSIGAVSVQPGGTGVVLAGTGDPNDALDSYYGEGILLSTDFGNTWTSVNEADEFSTVSTHSFEGEGFAGFAWGAGGMVVAAVTQAFDGVVVNALQANSMEGLYYSTDAGLTWQLATITDAGQSVQSPGTSASPGYDGNAATSVVWNPLRQMFFAVVRYHGYYGSPDGITWTRLVNQPGLGMSTVNCPTNPGTIGSASCPVFRGALAIQPVTGDSFAFTVDQNNLDQGIWQDVCAAVNGSCSTGTIVAFGEQIIDLPLEDSGAIAQGDYDLWLAAVPASGGSTDTLLYAGTEDIFKCSLAEGCVWRNATNVNTCAVAEVASSQHSVATLGALMFFGNDSGLWRTTDGINQLPTPCTPDDATHFNNLNSGLGSLAEVTDIAQDPTASGTLMAAQGVNGTSATTSAGMNANPGPWPQVLDGFSAYVEIDPANALNWYASSGYGVSTYLCPSGSACDAALFPATPLIGDEQTASDGETLENPAVWMLDPQGATLGQAKMIVGTCRVWRGSVAGGSANWSAANALSGMLDGDNGPQCDGNAQIRSLGASGTLSTPIYGPGTTQEVLYAGMDGIGDGGADDSGFTVAGHVYTTSVSSGTTGTSIWTDIALPQSAAPLVTNDPSNQGQFNPGGFAISSVVADTHDTSGQTVYATVQGISGDGLSEPTVYLSTNQGQSWTNITANLPTGVPVNALAVDPVDAQIVYVATDAGVYATTAVSTCSIGQSVCWSAFGTAMPDVPVTAIATWGTGTAGMLRAATYGRGIWQSALLSVQELSTPSQTTVTLTPSELVFGPQSEGTLSPTQSITVTNTGTNPLLVSSVQISGDYNEQDDCSLPIPVGSSCTVMLGFFPTATGVIPGQFTLSANVPGGSATAGLSGTGTPAVAQVVLYPVTGLTFPSTIEGQTSAMQAVTVSNIIVGGAPVSLQTPTVSGDYQIVINTCTAVALPQTSCTIEIVFSPTRVGTDDGTLSIITGNGTLTEQLIGAGVASGQPSLTPTELFFGGILEGTTTSPPQNIVVSNNAAMGAASVALQAPTVTSDYQITSNTCPSNLGAQTSCPIGVSFSPTKIGPDNGTLSIVIGAATFNTQLNGTGLAPATDGLSTTSLQFGSLTVGLVSAPQSVTITNAGGVALTSISAVSNSPEFGTTTNCLQLPGHQSCSVSVTFQPVAPGIQTGTLSIADALNGVAHTQTVSLSGVGVAPKFVASIGSVASFGAEGVAGSTGYNAATLTSQGLSFTNNGSTAVENVTFTTTGPFTAAAGTCGDTLPAGAACVAQVTFIPTAAGPQTGTVTVAGSNLDRSLTTALSGTGMEFTMAPAVPTTFTLVSGKSTTYTVSLVPSGNAASHWSGILSLACAVTPTGSGYVCTVPATAVLASGNSTSVTVTTAPATTAKTGGTGSQGASGVWRALGSGEFVLGCALPFCIRSRRRKWPMLAAVLLVVLSGCGVKATGGGGGGGGGGTGTNYTLTLTASAPGVEQSVSMTLVLEQ